CHFFDVLFIFTHFKHLLSLFHLYKLFYVPRDKKIGHPQEDRGSGGTTLLSTVRRQYVQECPLSLIRVVYRANLLALSLLDHELQGRFQCVSLETFSTLSSLLKTAEHVLILVNVFLCNSKYILYGCKGKVNRYTPSLKANSTLQKDLKSSYDKSASESCNI